MSFKNSPKDAWILAAATLGVLLTRLPFLSAGYGADPDAWTIIYAAQRMAATGRYQYSRFPCFPVPEIFYTGIYWAGPFGCNLVTAIFSAAVFLLFVLIMRHYKAECSLLGGFALAFTPVIFINSANTMDYIWALCFILGATYGVLRRRPVLAGISLGLAIGCRISSGAMLLPLSMLWKCKKGDRAKGDCPDLRGHRREALVGENGTVPFKSQKAPVPSCPWKPALLFTVVALATGAIAYLPPFYYYGTGFLRVYAQGYLPLAFVRQQFMEGVWGPVGVAALAVALAAAVVARLRGQAPYQTAPLPLISEKGDCPNSSGAIAQRWSAKMGLSPLCLQNVPAPCPCPDKWTLWCWILAVAIYVAAFFAAPHEAGYLIPALPFVILLLARGIDRRVFQFFCLAVIASSFITVNRRGVHLDGPMIDEHRLRRLYTARVDDIVRKTQSLPARSMVIAGSYTAMVWVKTFPPRADGPRYDGLIDMKKLNEYLAEGYSLYYTTGERDNTLGYYGFDLTDYGAKPIDVEP
jgi:hypothetical protein